MTLTTSIVGLLVLLATAAPTMSCRCVMKKLHTEYFRNKHNHVIRATATATYPVLPLYKATVFTVVKVYKGCPVTHVIGLSTLSSASCGIDFEIGTDYLLTLKSTFGDILSSCNFIRKWSALTAAEVTFLNNRFVCCDAPGYSDREDATATLPCHCAGDNVVNCFRAPCSPPTDSPPCPRGVECRDNYCGGCHAEWFTSRGLPACYRRW